MSIRIAGKKRSKSVGVQHRPFYERERELNKLTRADMYKEWTLRMDPYKMKALPDEGWKGGSNPFKYMSIYKIKEFIKTMEAKGDPYKEDNEEIAFTIEMIVTFKDMLRVTTSEAVACWIIFKDKLDAYLKDKLQRQKPKPNTQLDEIVSDETMAEMAHEAMQEFKADWDNAMKGLDEIWASRGK